jgi:hypothetical protein
MFDKDKDGRLNSTERLEAIRAITEDKFEDKFLWGIEGISANRILQKRGKVIQNDDFSVLKDSYPEHPLSNAPRRH